MLPASPAIEKRGAVDEGINRHVKNSIKTNGVGAQLCRRSAPPAVLADVVDGLAKVEEKYPPKSQRCKTSHPGGMIFLYPQSAELGAVFTVFGMS